MLHADGDEGRGAFNIIEFVDIVQMVIQVNGRNIAAIQSGDTDAVGGIVGTGKLGGQE